MSDFDDLLAALAPVVAALRQLGVRHYVGGSVASTFHGAIRSTMDVDLVCSLSEAAAAARVAVRDQKYFNLIHLPTSCKFDIFIDRGRQFDEAAFARARPEVFGPPAIEPIPVLTVEDSILAKLEWFRMTDETSERQWDDVLRVVRLHAAKLDLDYLQTMADSIRVRDLLDRVLAAARGSFE